MVLVALGALGACTATPKRALPPEHDAPAPLEHHAAEPEAAATLVRVEAGDRACYVTLRTAGGEATQPGDFALCPGGAYDASALVGKRVVLATKHDKIQAVSCQGNPDCADSEAVDLVVAIVPAP